MVRTKFVAGPCGPFNKRIVKIERVQNPRLWDAYYSCRNGVAQNRSISLGAPSSTPVATAIANEANEKWLFHGSRGTNPLTIAETGVDFRYSKSNVGCYSAGRPTLQRTRLTPMPTDTKCLQHPPFLQYLQCLQFLRCLLY